MAYVESQLARGERIIERLNHGRTAPQRTIAAAEVIIGGGFLASLAIRLTAWARPEFKTQVGPHELTGALDMLLAACLLSPAILIALASLATLVHVFWDDLALTDRRLVGRWQGRGPWDFRRVDLPLQQISGVESAFLALKIQPAQGKAFTLTNFPAAREFTAQLRKSIKET
jgi:hypothetical protein